MNIDHDFSPACTALDDKTEHLQTHRPKRQQHCACSFEAQLASWYTKFVTAASMALVCYDCSGLLLLLARFMRLPKQRSRRTSS
jgi:hypothetical protein